MNVTKSYCSSDKKYTKKKYLGQTFPSNSHNMENLRKIQKASSVCNKWDDTSGSTKDVQL